MATKTNDQAITIPAIDKRIVTIKIVGDTPLIQHKWSEKAKREILDKQTKKAKTKGKDAKDPFADFVSSMYWLDGEPEQKTPEGFAKAISAGARFGFPASAFKDAAVSAAYRAEIVKNKVGMNGAFRVMGELVEIRGSTPEMREDMVKIGMGIADIRYRGMFPEWWTELTIEYNAGMLSLEQLVNMFNLGGFACGVGEWRIEKGGIFGGFHVE